MSPTLTITQKEKGNFLCLYSINTKQKDKTNGHAPQIGGGGGRLGIPPPPIEAIPLFVTICNA